MAKAQQAITTTETTPAEEDAGRGLSSVSTLAVRVAGFVPSRVDVRFAVTYGGGVRQRDTGHCREHVPSHASADPVGDPRPSVGLVQDDRQPPAPVTRPGSGGGS